MVVSRQDNISGQVDHEGESLELVHDFKFLGSYATFYGCPALPAQHKRATMLYFANVFLFIFFYGRLILQPWLTEVRKNFTRGGP